MTDFSAWLDLARRDDLLLVLGYDALVPSDTRTLDHSAINVLSALLYSKIRIAIISNDRVDEGESSRVPAGVLWLSAERAGSVTKLRDALPGAHVCVIADGKTEPDLISAVRPDEVAVVVRTSRVGRPQARASLVDAYGVREFLWWLLQREGPPPLTL